MPPGAGRGGRGGGGAVARRGGKRRYLFRRRKFCKFCDEKVKYIDFKDVRTLQSFIPERGKILPRRTSGTCASHQRDLKRAIKRARNIALLPFTTE
ncbi:MAG: 30S ribosomal protein S18 [Acidobacteria bacterium]|nr:MAG: 30S ribosomal protein S18 [Acidobacteriota bacterium]